MNARITKKIISLNIDLISYGDALTKIVTWAKAKRAGYVCFANVHMTIEAYEDNRFANQVNAASLVLADGVPIVKTLKLFYGHSQERIAGMDIFPDLISTAAQNAASVFFFGTTDEVLNRIRSRAEQEFPNIKIAGAYSPAFNRSLDDESYIDMINASGADMVFVALGCPKQEKWMATHSHKINAVLLGVGGAFSVYAGLTQRAPTIMQKLGFEWLFRLFQEPNRLFKRYLKTNSLFIYLVLKKVFKNMLNKK